MKYVLIGKKNVGKSSIFNKIIGKKLNIVNPISGSTRDWIEHKSYFKNKIIDLIDTPGINPVSKKMYDKNIIQFIKKNINENYQILFVVSVIEDSINIDSEILRFLRKLNLDVILIINKIDNKKLENNAYKFLKFGIKKYFFISCAHNIGLNLLKKYLFEQSIVAGNNQIKYEKNELSIGVYGKPNVGKSTFVNNFIGFDRFQTGDLPGITTDSIYYKKTFNDKTIKIFDTAGIRQQNKILNSLDIESTNLSIKTIANTFINLLLIDCTNGLDRQDKRIINIINKKGIFLLIIFNKIDLAKNIKNLKNELIHQLYNEVRQAKNLKYFFISSLKKNNVKKIFDFICNEIVFDNYLSTSKINLWLKKVTNDYSHPLIKRRKVNFKYAFQLSKFPVIIKIFTNYPKSISESYKRYLMNNFTNEFKIKNQNIRIVFNKSVNPYI